MSSSINPAEVEALAAHWESRAEAERRFGFPSRAATLETCTAELRRLLEFAASDPVDVTGDDELVDLGEWVGDSRPTRDPFLP